MLAPREIRAGAAARAAGLAATASAWAGAAIAAAGEGLPWPRQPLVALPPPATPLAIEAASARRLAASGGTVWDVEATLRNPTDRPLRVPPVEVVLVSAAGETVARSRLLPPAPTLPGGQALAVSAATLDPARTAERVILRLNPQGLARP